MKIDRLIGILSILLQEEKTTAPELAERFEVSRRTINRDIEDLCKAGIPIKTAQGTGGGISIMDRLLWRFYTNRCRFFYAGWFGIGMWLRFAQGKCFESIAYLDLYFRGTHYFCLV